MSKRIGNTFYIKEEEPLKCEMCGKISELRPYGPNGESICFECGMKNHETTLKKFTQLLDEVEFVVGPNGVIH